MLMMITNRKGWLYWLMLFLCFLACFAFVFVLPAQQAKAALPLVPIAVKAIIAAVLVAAGITVTNNTQFALAVEKCWEQLSNGAQKALNAVAAAWEEAKALNPDLPDYHHMVAVDYGLATEICDVFGDLYGYEEAPTFSVLGEYFPVYSTRTLGCAASDIVASHSISVSRADIIICNSRDPVTIYNQGYPVTSSNFEELDFAFKAYSTTSGGATYVEWMLFIPFLFGTDVFSDWKRYSTFTLLPGYTMIFDLTYYEPFISYLSGDNWGLYFPYSFSSSPPEHSTVSYEIIFSMSMAVAAGWDFSESTYDSSISLDFPGWAEAAVANPYGGDDVYLPVVPPLSIDNIAGSISSGAYGQSVAQGADVIGNEDYVDQMEQSIIDQLAQTGEVVTDIGQNVGTITSNVVGIRGLLATISAAIAGIGAKVGEFFNVGEFSLDFDAFENLILPDRFPFCIPFDLIACIETFAANASDFVFRIDVNTQYWDVDHTVDLQPFLVYIAFFRYAACVWFSFILISKTRDMIKW